MKRMRNVAVADYWGRGRPAANHGGSFWTDGTKLFSYELQIGDTTDGIKVLRDYSAKGRHGFKSMTTSQHVGRARIAADIID